MQSFSSLDGLQSWFEALTMGVMTAHVAVWMLMVLYLPTLLFLFFISHYLKYEIKKLPGKMSTSVLNFIVYRNINSNLKINNGRKEHVAFSNNIWFFSLKITYFKLYIR